ncbi:MAG: DUF1501 domain-containing protein, partial [Pseudomonadota bacterium]
AGTPAVFAAAPGENRLVVLILRGAMDGIGVFAPYGDRDYAALRPRIALGPGDGLIDLDGRFGMHASLAPLVPLWRAGEMAAVHAVSTPYRGKRSHFDGQDILEAGVADIGAARDGWLNRALGHIGEVGGERAIAVGREDMLLMRGARKTRSWSPGVKLALENDERALLQMIYARDPIFADAAATAEALSEVGGGGGGVEGRIGKLAHYAAERLKAEARIAAFSVGGWDTHANQPYAVQKPLRELALAVTTLKSRLGDVWGRTLIVAMTEFGRTARENGNRGTDHGTGGAAVLAGGVLKGGRVFGAWPGIGEGDLYEGRDLMPTEDVRRYPAWALAALFGAERTALERDVFPGLDMGDRPGFVA